MLAIALAGCGRLHFDVSGDGSDDGLAPGRPDGSFTGSQAAYLKAARPDPSDGFGEGIAISADGTMLAVGAQNEASAMPGNDADNSAAGAGAVYVFAHDATGWVHQAYVKPQTPAASSLFGFSVAMSPDGGILAIGAEGEDAIASNSGAAFVFVRNGTVWTQQAYLKAPSPMINDQFGWSIAISGDGSTVAVGAPGRSAGRGVVFVFPRTGGSATVVQAPNPDAGDGFGWDVALSNDGATLAISANGEASAATTIGGNQADNSAAGAGAVYVFTRNGAAWNLEAYVKARNTDAGDHFGGQLALDGSGNRLAVSAYGESSASSDPADNSASQAGAIYTFTRAGGVWSPEAYLKASNAEAGDKLAAVALSEDGYTLACGAENEWGAGIGLGGDPASNGAQNSGAAYVFARTGTTWTQRAYVKALNTEALDGFGAAVALSADGSVLTVGALFEASGVASDPNDNSALGAGAAYVYY